MQRNIPLKKGIALTITVLFIGASIIPLTGSKSVEKTSFDPVPDLDCDGDLYIVNVEPGSTVTGSFTVSNIGEPYSLLDWEIESYPEWGTWTFIPSSGNDLTPEDAVMTVEVEIGVPDEIEYDLWGEVKVVNLENYSDFDIIIVFLKWKSVPVVKNINQQCTTSLINQNIMNTVSSTKSKNMEQSSIPTFDDLTIVSIQPSAQTVENGEWFNVGIYVEPSELIMGVSVCIYFDPTLIQAEHVRAEWDLFEWPPIPCDPPLGFYPGDIDNINGEIIGIYGIIMGLGTGASDPGYLCNITFIAQQEIGTSSLNLEDVIVVNEYYIEIPVEIHNGNVTVIDADTIPPEITDVMLTTSNPLDTEPGFGWENFTCTVTSDGTLDIVQLNLTLTGVWGDTYYYYFPMTNILGTDVYYYNTTLTDPGDYTYHIWANDTNGNQNSTLPEPFFLPTNEDVDMSGMAHFMDLIAIARHYNEEGPPGWIREDVDNNGEVHFMDLIAIVRHYGEKW